MDLDRFLNLLASIFGAMGSLYVLKGIAGLTPNLMERLSRTYWDFSTTHIDSLAAQKADSIVGMVLVVVAITMAVVSLAAVPPGIRAFGSRGLALALAASLAGVVYVSLVLIGGAIKSNQRLAVGRIITTSALSDLFERGRLTNGDIPSLRVYARDLLELQVDEREQPRQMLGRLADAVGKKVPPNFDFSEVETRAASTTLRQPGSAFSEPPPRC